MKQTLAFGLVLLAAFVLYTQLWQAPLAEPDTAGYLEVAEDLRDGSLSKVYARPPGYPLFLLAAGSSPEPGSELVRLQLVLHFVAVAALLHLLRRLGASAFARWAFVAVALLPPFVEHAVFVLTECVAECLLALGLAGTVLWLADGSRGWLAAAVLSLGCAGLVHPAHQGIPVVLGAGAVAWSFRAAAPRILRRRALVACAALVAGLALVSGSFSAYNAVRFGYAGTSPMLGVALSHKTVRVWERLPDEDAQLREILVRYRDALLVQPGADHLAYAAIFRAWPELQQATGLDDLALGRRLVALNLRLIRAAPLEYLDEVARSLVWYWGPGVTDVSAFGSSALKALWHAVRIAVLAGFGLALALLAGPALRFASARPPATGGPGDGALGLQLLTFLLAVAIVGYSSLVSASVTSAVWRMRVPFDLDVLLCVVLAVQLWRSLALRMPVLPPEIAEGLRRHTTAGSAAG